jgi:hypothetical protein
MLINETNMHTPFGMSSTAVGGRRRRRTRSRRLRTRRTRTRRTRTRRSRKGSRRMRKKYYGGVNPTYSSYSVGDTLYRSESALANPPPIKRIDLF